MSILKANKLAALTLHLKGRRTSSWRHFNEQRESVKGDAPSGRSAASFLPRDNSILGSSRATHSTRHVARVTFWNVDIAIPAGKTVTFLWENDGVRRGYGEQTEETRAARCFSSIGWTSVLTGGAEVRRSCNGCFSPLVGDKRPCWCFYCRC